MKIAPPTIDEAVRLKALYDYDILDTEAEKTFDDLTQLAAQICNTPITLISLIDPDRQWFKSRVGLDAEETSRDIAFCAHAIHQREIFEVEDTLQDQRFFNNPLVTSAPNIRFYAGTVLVSPDGYAIGTLCVIDDKPNKLTQKQRQALEVLGRSVISQMELRKNIKQLKQANQHKTEFLSNMSHELRTPLNAIKFTNSGKWVKVELSSNNENLVITVADKGVGISSVDQKKLFGKFQQVGQAKSSEGSGLGLSITQGLVNLLGGNIKVLSTLGSGSIFKVILPQPSDAEILRRSPITAPIKNNFNHKRKILLVEDNKINQAVMLATFESLGISITIAETGENALDIVNSRHFDVIFMDIHLPGIDGRQASEQIKQVQPHIPIFALSADTFNQHKFAEDDKIWDEYLSKPLEKEKLVQVLNRYIPLLPSA
jgi:CheY-like chemotaxis protein